MDKIESAVKLEGKKVLEIGCGNGARTLQIALRCKEVEAIEPDSKMLSEASLNSRPNVHFALGSAEKLEFESETFDLTIFTLSLHHVPPTKMAKAIDEAVRVTKKDGHIIFLEPSFSGTFFESELAFDACDGDERKEKALAYYTMLNHSGMKEVAELEDETVFTFDSVEDFVKSLSPKKNTAELKSFLEAKKFQLSASRRINIFKTR